MRTRPSQRSRAIQATNESWPFVWAMTASRLFAAIMSILARPFTRYTSGKLGTRVCRRDANASAAIQVAKTPTPALAWNAFEHFGVRRKFFDEHEQALDRLFGFVPGETAPYQIDFLQLPRLQQQFFAPRTREEDVDCGINALIADFPVKHHLHISRAFEFLKDQFVHAAACFDESRRHNGERAGFFSVSRRSENLSRDFHGARVDAAAHGATASCQRIVECARGTGDRVEENEDVFARFHETFCALAGKLRDACVTLDVTVI